MSCAHLLRDARGACPTCEVVEATKRPGALAALWERELGAIHARYVRATSPILEAEDDDVFAPLRAQVPGRLP